MPFFTSSKDRDDDEDNPVDEKTIGKLKDLNASVGDGNSQEHAEEGLIIGDPHLFINMELFTDNILEFVDGVTQFSKLRLVCKFWNNIVLGNESYTNQRSLVVDFSRKKIKTDRFYSTAETGIFKSVVHLSLKSLHNGLRKIRVGNETLIIPGKTIATRGYARKTNVGGSVLKYFPNLKTLNLDGNEVADENHNWFSDMKSTCLEVLNMEDNNLGLKTCQHLIRCENFVTLTLLNLRLNSIGDEGCRLLGSSYLTKLKILDISSNGITVDGLLHIPKAEFAQNLVELVVCDNPIGDTLYQYVREGKFKFAKLSKLSLLQCNLSGDIQSTIINEMKMISLELNRIVM